MINSARGALTGRIGDGQCNAPPRQIHEVEAITAERAHLPAAGMIVSLRFLAQGLSMNRSCKPHATAQS